MSEVNIGGVEITDFTLLGSAGATKLNLVDIVLEFNIYENIEQPFMTADFILEDSLSLTTALPITGQEMIQVEFKVPVMGMKEKPFKKIFRVMSIKKFTLTKKQRNARYILRCYDPAYFKNITTKIQKSYSSMPVSEMAEKITKEYLGLKDKEITSEKTDGNTTLVIPNMHPDEALISLLTRYARSSKYGDVSKYYFYSSQSGYKFTSLEALLDHSARKGESNSFSIDNFTLREKNLPVGITELDKNSNDIKKTENNASKKIEDLTKTSSKKPMSFLRINDIEFINKMNVEDSIRSGMYDNTVMWINPSLSLFEKKVYKYTDDFKKFKVLCEKVGFKVIDDEFTSSSEFKNLNGKSKEFFIITNKGDRSNESSEDKRYTFLNYSKATEMMMNNVILNLTIPGDNTRAVGDIIDLSLPQFGATDDIMKELDKFISGYYLVTAVRHIYNLDSGYSCVLRCMKNCFDNAVQDQINKAFDGKSATTEKVVNEPEVQKVDERTA